MFLQPDEIELMATIIPDEVVACDLFVESRGLGLIITDVAPEGTPQDRDVEAILMKIVAVLVEGDETLVHPRVAFPFSEDRPAGGDAIVEGLVLALTESALEVVVAGDEKDLLEFLGHPDEKFAVAIGVRVLGVSVTPYADCRTGVTREKEIVDVGVLLDVKGIVGAVVLEMDVGCYLKAECFGDSFFGECFGKCFGRSRGT